MHTTQGNFSPSKRQNGTKICQILQQFCTSDIILESYYYKNGYTVVIIVELTSWFTSSDSAAGTGVSDCALLVPVPLPLPVIFWFVSGICNYTIIKSINWRSQIFTIYYLPMRKLRKGTLLFSFSTSTCTTLSWFFNSMINPLSFFS
jgi:hypothetical protein